MLGRVIKKVSVKVAYFYKFYYTVVGLADTVAYQLPVVATRTSYGRLCVQ